MFENDLDIENCVLRIFMLMTGNSSDVSFFIKDHLKTIVFATFKHIDLN